MATTRWRIARSAVIGSLSFWLPIVISRALFGADRGVLLTILPLTFLLPVFCCLVLEVFTQKWRLSRPAFAGGMILGIWLTGPFWMMVANTSTAGEGFHMAGSWSSTAFMTAFFPASTFMMATYEGSLFALLFTTFSLLLFSITPWSFQPLLDRCVVCRMALTR
jgi:hypothetical protein